MITDDIKSIIYPKVNAPRSQFNWTKYRNHIQVCAQEKREYHELVTAISESQNKKGVQSE